MHKQRVHTELQRTIGGDPGEADALLAEVQADPTRRIRVFVRDWTGVDRLRVRIEAAGLSDRISVHHRAALGCLGLPRAA